MLGWYAEGSVIFKEELAQDIWISWETFLVNGNHDIGTSFAINANMIWLVMEVCQVEPHVIVNSAFTKAGKQIAAVRRFS